MRLTGGGILDNSQAIKLYELGDTPKNHEDRNGEIHHATTLQSALRVPMEALSRDGSWLDVQDVGEVHAGGLVGEMWEPHFE